MLTQKDLATLSSIAALVDELTQSGGITDHERAALLNNTWNDSARNRAADQARYRDAPFAHALQPTTNEKAIMNPKLIMDVIEKNHAVMEAQIEKFAALAPKSPPCVTSDGTVTVASLLQAAMLGHLQGAAESLQTLGEVESIIRDSDETVSGHPESVIIEGEATVVHSEEMK